MVVFLCFGEACFKLLFKFKLCLKLSLRLDTGGFVWKRHRACRKGEDRFFLTERVTFRAHCRGAARFRFPGAWESFSSMLLVVTFLL